VRIVLVVFIRFFLPKVGSAQDTSVGEDEDLVMRTWGRILQRGISALVIVFLFAVRVSTCLCVSLQRAVEFCIHQSYMTWIRVGQRSVDEYKYNNKKELLLISSLVSENGTRRQARFLTAIC
jgi:hypothetical protein